MVVDALSSRVETIFLRVIELPEDDRSSFLDDACREDADARSHVEALLRGGRDAVSTAQLKHALGLTLLTTPAEVLPIRLDRYDLEARIGEGSFGVVYRASQHTPVRRKVAVKVLRPGLDSADIVRRFESERQALAGLDHPNVARLFDAGNMPDGRPYFVLELLEGSPLTAFCDARKLHLHGRLELFLEVCAGVEHAHRRALLHRDLKPSNILVTTGDIGAPRQVKVIDFGIARALEDTDSSRQFMTDPGRPLGTPEYMSPEQIDGQPGGVDTRSDVYALGVVLYQLLCGRLPFDSKLLRSAPPAEMRRVICEVEPAPPGLNDEVEWIAMRALRKDPRERYRGVAELADDVRNYLANRPLLAGPDTRLYRARKWATRYRRSLIGAAALLLVATLTAVQYFRSVRLEQRKTLSALSDARQQRDEAARQRRSADAINEFLGGMLSSVDPAIARGEQVRVLDVLDRAATDVGTRFAQQPDIEMSVRRVIGDTYLALGKPDRAAEQVNAALSIVSRVAVPDPQTIVQLEASRIRAILGLGKPREAAATGAAALARARAPSTFLIESAYGEALLAAGQYAEAEQRISRLATSPHPSDLSRDARITLEANHARCVLAVGKQYVALPLFASAASLAAATLGDDHPQTIQIKSEYAGLLTTVGRFAEAEPLLRDSVARARRIMGDDHPATLNVSSQLAQLLKTTGRFEQARELVEQLISQHKTRFGDDHPDAINYSGSRAMLLQSLARFDAAAELYRDVLARRRRVLGDDHPETLATESGYAWLLIESGQRTQGQSILKTVVPRLRRILGDDHPETLSALNNYALSLDMASQFDEAEACFKEVIDRAPKLLKWDCPQISGVYNNYGNLLQSRPDRKEEALAQQLKALEVRARLFGADSLDAAQSHCNVAIALLAVGRFAEAEQHARKSLEDRERQLGSEHPSFLHSLGILALAVDELDHIDNAERMHRQIVETRRRTLGGDADATLDAEINLASVLARMRRTSESVELFRHVYKIYASQRAVDDPRMQMVAFRLAVCLDRVGERSQSDEIRERYHIPRDVPQTPTTRSTTAPTEAPTTTPVSRTGDSP